MNARIQIKYSKDSFGAKFEYPSPKLIFYKLLHVEPAISCRFNTEIHIVPGGTDKSNGGDYENHLRYV